MDLIDDLRSFFESQDSLGKFLAQIVLYGALFLVFAFAFASLRWVLTHSEKQEVPKRTRFYFLVGWGVVWAIFLPAVRLLPGADDSADLIAALTILLATTVAQTYFFLNEKFGDASKSISSALRLAKATEELEPRIRDIVHDLIEHMRARATSLRELVNGHPNLTQSDGAVLLKALEVKMRGAVDQVVDAEHRQNGEHFYLRRVAFHPVWEALTAASGEYISVCDLSPYYNIVDLDSDIQNWRRRAAKEAAHLANRRAVGELKQFDKIFLYRAREGADAQTAPCHSGDNPRCDVRSCQVVCIVKSVVTTWQAREQELRSHLSSRVTDSGGVFWLADRASFGPVGKASRSTPDGRGFDSMDIGLFGNAFVGEEFKIKRDEHATGGRSFPGEDNFDLLYLMRQNPDLHASAKELIEQELKAAKYVWPA